MSSFSVFTTMTNPDSRNDPWKESLNCYNALADEVVVVGDDWPLSLTGEFLTEYIKEDLMNVIPLGNENGS